ncbi:protein of unknown function [Candidatus Methylacidiphilum fumarolicum]|uniref:Uncharacterized protein n=1 Tax=Candidatus Methylacidiphilum fumarolicum TaxID=591154 RepID=A0ABN8XK24_9BACT|nr:protein of unknown function [Candidatus Methylacidiphilum fumarolicum]
MASDQMLQDQMAAVNIVPKLTVHLAKTSLGG